MFLVPPVYVIELALLKEVKWERTNTEPNCSDQTLRRDGLGLQGPAPTKSIMGVENNS